MCQWTVKPQSQCAAGQMGGASFACADEMTGRAPYSAHEVRVDTLFGGVHFCYSRPYSGLRGPVGPGVDPGGHSPDYWGPTGPDGRAGEATAFDLNPR